LRLHGSAPTSPPHRSERLAFLVVGLLSKTSWAHARATQPDWFWWLCPVPPRRHFLPKILRYG
jgi:hypothetical protein